MAGKGAAYFAQSFEALASRTMLNFDIIISDQSSDNQIEKLCHEWQTKLDIKPSGSKRAHDGIAAQFEYYRQMIKAR